MKFTCERCGKKYATAEDPAPGRVYKLRCKACGHLIVVKASAGAHASAPAPEPHGPGETHPAATPEIQLEVAPPEPATPPGPGTPPPLDATTEVSMAGLSIDPAPWPHATPPPGPWVAGAPEAPPPAPAQAEGYVDLFGDGPREAEKAPKEDPFLAAARASLPDGYGAGNAAAPDPLGGLREELAAGLPPHRDPAPYRSTTKVPAIPKPAAQKSAAPLVLIGAGALVLVGILGFVLLGGKGVDPQPRAVAQAPAPVPAPPAPPPPSPPVQEAPPPEAEPAKPPAPAPAAAPAPKPPDDARRAAEERRRRDREEAREREAQAKAEREARERAAREAREARERDRLEREQRAREVRDAQERARREAQQREAERVAAANIPVAEAGLSQAQIEKVLLATRKAFDGCLEEAKATGMKLDGRRVLLRLNIQTSGAVTYPTLDDVTLNATDLGGCLKSAARLMVFPKFKGDTMQVEVPLVLR